MAALAAVNAADVKRALRGRHPGADNGGMVGQWTCIEEWRGIDLLALNAWSKADVIGYEVKVSRGDMRSELLRPDKRKAAVEATTEFYFAVPAGLLLDREVEWEEPVWEPSDFEREVCPGVAPFGGRAHPRAYRERWGGLCSKIDREERVCHVNVPVPEVLKVPSWMRGDSGDAAVESWVRQRYMSEYAHRAVCWTCGGKGYVAKARVEVVAPKLWVPADVGLIEVSGRGCTVVKASPKRKDPKLIAGGRQSINQLVRWVSHRPDPRHRVVTVAPEQMRWDVGA